LAPAARLQALYARGIRFAMKELPPQLFVGTYLEVDEVRYEGGDIRRLCESVDYPHARTALTIALARDIRLPRSELFHSAGEGA
jgi:hypothetical protein